MSHQKKSYPKMNLLNKVDSDEEPDKTSFCDPNFDFDYKYTDKCYSSIDRFKDI